MDLICISVFILIIIIVIRLSRNELKHDIAAFKTRFSFLLFIAVIGIIISSYIFYIYGSRRAFPISDREAYSLFIDPIISILTFVIALLLGIQGVRKRWEESLPNRFTVHYVYNNQILGSFFDAHVVGKEDIRNQAQSLGSEMMGGGRLKLTTNNDLYPHSIEKKANNYYKHWTYIMRLNSPPSVFEKGNFEINNSDGACINIEGNLNNYFLYTIDEDTNTKEAVKGLIYYTFPKTPDLLYTDQNKYFQQGRKARSHTKDHNYEHFRTSLSSNNIKTNFYITGSKKNHLADE